MKYHTIAPSILPNCSFLQQVCIQIFLHASHDEIRLRKHNCINRHFTHYCGCMSMHTNSWDWPPKVNIYYYNDSSQCQINLRWTKLTCISVMATFVKYSKCHGVWFLSEIVICCHVIVTLLEVLDTLSDISMCCEYLLHCAIAIIGANICETNVQLLPHTMALLPPTTRERSQLSPRPLQYYNELSLSL